LLDDVIQQAVSLSLQQNNRFEFDAVTPLPVRVSTDPARLQQVLLNLLSNAAKFTRSGVVRLTVGTHQSNGRDALEFAVIDTGTGIDAAAQSTIFKEFEQIEKRRGSAGLGLYIAQRIVENLQGELHLDSTPGEGSRFRFWIPAQPFSHEVAELPAYRSPAAGGSAAATPGAHATPRAKPCIDLARLARDGQLSDIEAWLQQYSSAFADSQEFVDEVSKALQMLDFARIEAMALAAANEKNA
jgi:hypothetical protein